MKRTFKDEIILILKSCLNEKFFFIFIKSVVKVGVFLENLITRIIKEIKNFFLFIFLLFDNFFFKIK